ncbi:MAG: ABC transporter ATP-binding protein/permease [Oscillospiraceae bacterium]|nr:ABC transporter ATP-binding protein/permease [Oscillospiraceae bacterium]
MDKHWIRYSIKWSMPLIKAYKWKLLLILALTLFSVGLTLIQVNFIQQSVDAVLARNVGLLLRVLFLFITITVLKLIYIYVYGQIYNNVFISMEKDLKNKFVHKILRTKMKEINKENSGDLNTKCNSDIPNALDFIRRVLSTFIFDPIMAIGGFIYLLCYSWKLSLFVFIPLPIIAVLLNIMSNKASEFYRKIQGLNSDYTEHIYDVIHGAETIKTYNMQKIQMKKIRKTLFQILKENKKYNINDAISCALGLAVTYVPSVISMIFGAYLVTAGEINISLLFGYSNLVGRVAAPVLFSFSALISMKNAYQSMKRLDTVMDLEEEKANGKSLITNGDTAVNFANVKFGYNPGISVFENFGLKIKKGQCVGIVGNSGAGKSTIVQLLSGLYETDSGIIELFGQDIQGLDLDDLRSHISYVSQQTYIMPGTIYENIQFNNLNASEDDILRAVKWAGLKDYIDTLPDGLNTVLSEDGSNLSGGQRQRISLARAFLRNSSIYIFDEPTSSLDPETEKQIVQKIDEVVRQNNITSVIISHNIKTIKNCDEIYFIREGKIIENGTLEELLKRENEFYNQFKYTINEVETNI